MANLTIRRNKGAALTHDELDNNFVALNNDIIDSSQIINLIDSDYVQARQITYDFLDSAEAIALIDSAYVNARVNLANSLDSAEVIALIDSAYVQARQITYDFLDSAEVINLVDSAYVQSRVTLRDSSFVTGLIDSAYLSVIVDSSYISNRSSSSGGGIGSIQLITTASSVTKVGDGDVFVEIAGGGGGGAANSYNGGQSYGRGVFHNVADGSVITVSAIGAGGLVYGVSSGVGGTGGSTTVYVDSANGQKLIMGGGGGSHATNGGGNNAHVPTASGGATALPGPMGDPGGSLYYQQSPSGLGIGPGSAPYNQGARYGYGVGAGYNHGGGANGNGTPGAVLLIGV